MSFLLSTDNQNLQSILGNGYKYSVPRFQRDYSWTQEQWDDLWNDIESLAQEKQHYMGYLVLQRGSDREVIIDGQQRLTTLSILILAALKHLHASNDDADQQRAEAIRHSYIGSLDAVSLTTYNKLELNRNNKQAFNKLSALEPLPIRKIKRTNQLMGSAFEFFVTKLTNKNGQQIAELIDSIAKGLIFTRIIVDDELNAYKVFETLNSRGVQLSTPDLLKNYLFSKITSQADILDEELEQLDERWEGIVYQLGKLNFSHFLRADWNSCHLAVNKHSLFTELRNKIHSRDDAYHYLKQLETNAPVYAALFAADDELWTYDGYRGCRAGIQALNLFAVKQPLTILLAAYMKFSSAELTKLLSYVVPLSIRYNVICNHSLHELQTTYNKIACRISQGEYERASHVKNSPEFKKLYPSDETFIAAFANKTLMQSAKKAKFLLSEIEQHLSHNGVTNEEATIEHILPERPDGDWIAAFGDGWETAVNRIGNLLLLSRSENKAAARLAFAQKKVIYRKNGSGLADKVCHYTHWNSESLHQHQQWLAELAAQIWRIDYS